MNFGKALNSQKLGKPQDFQGAFAVKLLGISEMDVVDLGELVNFHFGHFPQFTRLKVRAPLELPPKK